MKRVGLLTLACLLCNAAVTIPAVQAAWTGDGVNIVYMSHADAELSTCSIASDGTGGAIIAYGAADPYGYGSNNMVRLIDGDGIPQWGSSPASFGCMRWTSCARSAPDGAGGIFIACGGMDAAGYAYVCAARILHDGSIVPFSVSSSPGMKFNPDITDDGSGGAIIVWEEVPGGADKNIMAQRVNSSGTSLWSASGVSVCTQTDYQEKPLVVSDGGGGAIVVWRDRRAGNYDIYTQRIEASGTAVWTADGVAICIDGAEQLNIDLISDGTGGAIITWMDERGGDRDVFAQRIDAAGAVQWTTDGMLLCAAASDQDYPRLVPAALGGSIVAWIDRRDGDWDIYAQRFDSNGTPQWADDGAAVIAGPGQQVGHAIVTDGGVGAILTWSDNRHTHYDIYTQKIDWFGALQWSASGVPVCTATGDQFSLIMTADGAGGAVAAWMDYRDWDYGEVYAMRIHEDLPPVATLLQQFSASLDGSGITIRWKLSEAGRDMTFTLFRAEGISGALRELPAPEIARNGLSFSFTDPTTEGGTIYRYRVEVQDEAGSRTLFETEPIHTPALPLTLHQNHPNPFNPVTEIAYYLPAACRVTLVVFDITGRKVTTLVDADQAKGTHRVAWDGCTSEGIPTSSGTYFCRLTADKETRSLKMVLMR